MSDHPGVVCKIHLPLLLSAICNPISADLSGFSGGHYFFNSVICTPDETTMQVRVPGVGALLLDCWLWSLSFWPPGDALCTNFHKWEVVMKWKEPLQNVFDTVLLNLGSLCFYAEERGEWDYYTRSCVYLSFFSRSICKHLRASLNYAAETIFASLLWCKGFDSSQLA